MISSDFNSVMNKIRLHLKEKLNRKIYDVDIAKALNISKEHLSRCKKEKKIPLEPIITFCAKENIVINYILFDQMPDSLYKSTDKIISIKYFKNVNTSAGGGALNYEEDYEYLGIEKEVVEQLGGIEKLKHIEALNVIGESMEPVIKDKSIIFIDTTQIYPSYDKKDIYVVNTPNGVLVKKVILIPKYEKVQLFSCNPLFTHEIYNCEEIKIIGKVIGVSSC